jgi:hypothetical protein
VRSLVIRGASRQRPWPHSPHRSARSTTRSYARGCRQPTTPTCIGTALPRVGARPQDLIGEVECRPLRGSSISSQQRRLVGVQRQRTLAQLPYQVPRGGARGLPPRSATAHPMNWFNTCPPGGAGGPRCPRARLASLPACPASAQTWRVGLRKSGTTGCVPARGLEAGAHMRNEPKFEPRGRLGLTPK